MNTHIDQCKYYFIRSFDDFWTTPHPPPSFFVIQIETVKLEKAEAVCRGSLSGLSPGDKPELTHHSLISLAITWLRSSFYSNVVLTVSVCRRAFCKTGTAQNTGGCVLAPSLSNALRSPSCGDEVDMQAFKIIHVVRMEWRGLTEKSEKKSSPSIDAWNIRNTQTTLKILPTSTTAPKSFVSYLSTFFFKLFSATLKTRNPFFSHS